MNLLAAKLYDPSSAVSKATSALLAMTAFDTTNLRLAITVPAHGMVRFRLRCALEGATTFPEILLGVLNGASVIGRVAPQQVIGATALATTRVVCDAEFTATGLTPGAMNCDAAYGVEIVVASTNIKYGGPNNTTTDDAWGGFVFEAWDPQPQTANSTLAVDASGRVDVGKVLGTAQTAGDLKASMNTLQTDTDDIQTRLPAALVGGRIDASVGAMAANVLTAAAINADAITAAKIADGAIDAATFAAGAIDATAFAQGAADKVWSTAARVLTAGTNIVLAKGVGVTGFNDLSAAQVNTECDTALLDVGVTAVVTGRIDAAVSSRLSAAGYTAPDNATIATISTAVGAVKLQTDRLVFTAPGFLDVNVLKVNGITVVGDGQPGTEWNPA